jgi:flagellar basal-body rod modification protein FlgD
MPVLGRPESTAQKNFKEITLNNNKRPEANVEEKDIGKKLNKIAGNKEEEFRFKDKNEHNKLDKDGFLKLLTHQLTNQDPTSPMDQKKFSSELAQISQLEQLTNMNSKLDKLSPNAAMEAKSMAASFLGKEVRTNGTSLNYDGASETVNIPFHLEKDAGKVIVRLRDEKAQIVRQIEVDNLNRGSTEVKWDGKGSDNLPATKGKYAVEVLAYEPSGMPFTVKTQSYGKVIAAGFEDGEMQLTLEGKQKVFLRDVENFRLAKEETKNDNQAMNVPAGIQKLMQEKIESSYGKQQDQ